MPRPAVAAASPNPSEQRRPLRKDVFLSGILVDLDGRGSSDCIIRDINPHGASITLCKTLPQGAQTILLDTNNRVAHFARVVWSSAGRTGLFFVRSYKLSKGLPPRLGFLWTFLLEANLLQAQQAVANGIPAGIALASIGLTREQMHQVAPYARRSRRVQQLLESTKRMLGER